MTKAKYNGNHPRIRAQLKPDVDAGLAHCTEPICLMPDRWIEPGTPWDLAHDTTPDGHRGPAHAHCNRSEGGKRGHQASCRNPRHNHQQHASRDW